MKILSRENIISILVVGIFALLVLQRFLPEEVRIAQSPSIVIRPQARTATTNPVISRDAILTFILEHEGGLTGENGDGGFSNHGITELSWTEWREKQADIADIPESVKDATDVLIKRFYHDYFSDFHVWEVHEILQLIYADLSVQAGHEATKLIQRLVHSHPDGIWGSETASAVFHYNTGLTSRERQRQAFNEYDLMKRAFLKYLGKHPDHKDDLPGWIKRADDVKTFMAQYLK